MLPKEFKLPINFFPKDARRISEDRYLILKSVSNNMLNNRLGVVVGKHISKSAPKRNKLRRIVFDFFRLSAGFLGEKKHAKDLLIILKPSIMKLTKRDLEARLEKYVILV